MRLGDSFKKAISIRKRKTGVEKYLSNRRFSVGCRARREEHTAHQGESIQMLRLQTNWSNHVTERNKEITAQEQKEILRKWVIWMCRPGSREFHLCLQPEILAEVLWAQSTMPSPDLPSLPGPQVQPSLALLEQLYGWGAQSSQENPGSSRKGKHTSWPHTGQRAPNRIICGT